jgi:hypothetical protein
MRQPPLDESLQDGAPGCGVGYGATSDSGVKSREMMTVEMTDKVGGAEAEGVIEMVHKKARHRSRNRGADLEKSDKSICFPARPRHQRVSRGATLTVTLRRGAALSCSAAAQPAPPCAGVRRMRLTLARPATASQRRDFDSPHGFRRLPLPRWQVALGTYLNREPSAPSIAVITSDGVLSLMSRGYQLHSSVMTNWKPRRKHRRHAYYKVQVFHSLPLTWRHEPSAFD